MAVFKLPRAKNAKQHNPDSVKVEPTREYANACRLRGSDRWKRLRIMVLKRHPLCLFCGKPADEVHHIEQASQRPDLFFDVYNLAPLCKKHHEQVHASYKRGFGAELLFPEHKRLKLDE